MSTTAIRQPSRPAQPGQLDIDAVVFDMDGLLLDTERLAFEALQLAAIDVGLDLPRSVCDLLIGVPVDGCRLLLRQRYGASVPADRLLHGAGRHLDAMVEAGALQLKPGVLDLLAQLDATGLRRAVATSSARDKALRHLRSAGIGSRFDAVVTRDDVARGKPHPDLFLRAAAQLGTDPGRCLALEDSYNGVRAAHACGMRVIMVPDRLAPTDEMHAKCLCVQPDLHAVGSMFLAS